MTKQSKRVIWGVEVCRYVRFLCVWTGKFSLCYAWDEDSRVGSRIITDGEIWVRTDARRVNKHAGAETKKNTQIMTPKPRIYSPVKTQKQMINQSIMM